jgi:hypothetical protein
MLGDSSIRASGGQDAHNSTHTHCELRGAAASFPLASLASAMTVASYGHPSYQLPSECVDKWRVRYLVHLSTPPRGTVCRAQPPFQAGSPGLPATDAP